MRNWRWRSCRNPPAPPTWPARSRRWLPPSGTSPVRSGLWPCCRSPPAPPTWPAQSRRWLPPSPRFPARSRSWFCCRNLRAAATCAAQSRQWLLPSVRFPAQNRGWPTCWRRELRRRNSSRPVPMSLKRRYNSPRRRPWPRNSWKLSLRIMTLSAIDTAGSPAAIPSSGRPAPPPSRLPTPRSTHYGTLSRTGRTFMRALGLH